MRDIAGSAVICPSTNLLPWLTLGILATLPAEPVPGVRPGASLHA